MSKTNIYKLDFKIDHYKETLGAYHLGGQLMVIDTIAAKKLVAKYFKPK